MTRGLRGRGAGVRRTGDDRRRRAGWSRSSLPHGTQEGRRRAGGIRASRIRCAGSASSARASWARRSPATAVLQAGVEVRLKDADLARVGRGLKAATDMLAARARAPADDAVRIRAAASDTFPGPAAFDGFGGADLVIEAVFEELAVKRQVIGEVERAVPRDDRHRHQHVDLPVHDIAAGAAASRARPRHALLLAGGEDAAARGDSHRRDQRRRDRHRGAVRSPDGEDGDRRCRLAGILGQPDPAAVPQRGGASCWRKACRSR